MFSLDVFSWQGIVLVYFPRAACCVVSFLVSLPRLLGFLIFTYIWMVAFKGEQNGSQNHNLYYVDQTHQTANTRVEVEVKVN